jgi:predicted ester cyclase
MPSQAALQRLMDAANSGDVEHVTTTIDELVEPTLAAPLKEVWGRLLRAYPDLHITVEDQIAEGDKLVVRNTVTGTHLGEYMGIAPTGRSVSYDEIFILRFAGGRIAETWGVVDVLAQLRQLGAVA